MHEYQLSYSTEAAAWEQALPLGNGQLGAMAFGRAETEILRLNEETVWTGSVAEYDNPACKEKLPLIRQKLFNGEYEEAYGLCKQYLKSDRVGNSIYEPDSPFGTYCGAGDLLITLKDRKNKTVKRSLDILHGVAETCTEQYTARHFISFEADTAVSHFAALKEPLTFEVRYDPLGGGSSDGSARFEATKKNIAQTFAGVTAGNNEISYSQTFSGNGTLRWVFDLKAVSDGGCTVLPDGLLFENVTELTLYYTVSTSFDGLEPEQEVQKHLASAIASPYAILLQKNSNSFEEMMLRSELCLSEDMAAQHKDTDSRLRDLQNGIEDNGLFELYFNFGKYLLIASSSPQSRLPANLQGIWTKGNCPPWGADYHININLQMNYWPAAVTGLSDCCKSLYDFYERLYPFGKKTASNLYGCRGWVTHHTVNPWGCTSRVADPRYSIFTTSTPWCLRQLFVQYAYTGDRAMLKKHWKLIRECALFFADFLVRDDKTGYLVVSPSVSPENTFIDPKTDKPYNVCYGATMDNEILLDFFRSVLAVAEDAGERDENFLRTVRSMAEQLPPLRIGKLGTVMEWNEDFEEADPGHRHISHLYALYPAEEISFETPELMNAAQKTLERRLSHGGGHTGWSRAWIVNMYARMHDGENAFAHLKKLLTVSTMPNLFDDHPPFQIDGNFGGCASIAEMLLSSAKDEKVLPALPKAWQNGYFRNFCMRGGRKASCRWKDRKITELKIE